jgi:5-methylcytosine-specific restriction enzyme subunit McrC
MIPVKNIYYMLSYAFQVLKEQGYKDIETENFDNTANLFAAILIKGIALQVRRGLNREYIPKVVAMTTLRGKIEITQTIKNQSVMTKQIVCSYDEFSGNTNFNRILKSSIILLLRANVSKERKKQLRKLLVYFSNVDTIDLYNVDWNINYNRNNKTYHLLISICNLLVKGLLQTKSDGTTMLMDFLDEQRMCRLYEKFILEYYRKEFPEISANASQIPWQLDDDFDCMLPIMQSDIMLQYKEKVLIIDAKYYEHITQTQYETQTLHSANLYQIFTYVKNKEAQLKNVTHNVSGMLLYARTDEAIIPDNTYHMSGNEISVKTLNLNCEFFEIARQLNCIVFERFNIKI